MYLPTNCNHSVDPLYSFCSSSLPSAIHYTVLCISVSMCLFLFIHLFREFWFIFFFNSTFECNQMVFVFFWLSITPSSSIHGVTNGKNSCFLWLSSISLCVYVCMYVHTQHIYSFTYWWTQVVSISWLLSIMLQWTQRGIQFSSVIQSCQTFCNPMNRSTPGLPVQHQLPEFTQTHVHRVSDAIQPSHPLSFPSLPALNLSQNQGLFKWVSSSYQVAKVLEFQLQLQSFQRTPRTDLL